MLKGFVVITISSSFTSCIFTQLPNAAPSLQDHYSPFITTTSCSAPLRYIDIPLLWCALIKFLLPLSKRFSCSIEEPRVSSCYLYTGCHPSSKQVALGLLSEIGTSSDFDILLKLTMLPMVRLSLTFSLPT